MEVRFWGMRGGAPVSGKESSVYGGNTACVEVRCGSTLIILDAGSGLIHLGQQLMQEQEGRPLDLHLFLSHTHWDHILGIPYFLPAYRLAGNLNVYGVAGAGETLLSLFQGAQAGEFFPVTMGRLTMDPVFHELKEKTQVGDAVITYYYLNHPGLTLGFRVEHEGRSLVYLTDTEPYRRSNRELVKVDEEARYLARIDREVVAFARLADLLIADASCSEEECELYSGTGHSTAQDALQIAITANARRLVLFHHPPLRTDAQIDALAEKCRRRVESLRGKLEVLTPREGEAVQI